MLGVQDLKMTIDRLVGGEDKLRDDHRSQLIQNILEEADFDDDGSLSFAEFEHIVDKSSDFCK